MIHCHSLKNCIKYLRNHETPLDMSKLVDISDSDVLNICCGHYARTFAKFLKVTIDDWWCAAIGDVPSGFLSQQCRLIVKCQVKMTDRTKIKEEVSFFVKAVPEASPTQAQYIADFGAFKKEVRLYKTLLPRLVEATGIEFAPHCYLTKEFNCLAFEDLHTMGFRMASSVGGSLDQAHLLVTLDALASLHASSMIFEKEQNLQLDSLFPGFLDENSYPTNSNLNNGRITWVANTTTALSALIPEIPQFANHSQIAHIRRCFEKIIYQIFEFSKPSTRFRNAFNHGDLWKNNILFKYATISDGDQRNVTLPVEAKFVDFQLARYAPPALDVMTICTMVTSSEFRKTHLNRMIDAYYTHLESVLHQNGLSVAVELPRLEFDTSCEYYRLAGLIESCCFSHLVLLPDKMTQSIVGGSEAFSEFMEDQRVPICLSAFRQDKVYRNRMTDMISAIIDEYVLSSL